MYGNLNLRLHYIMKLNGFVNNNKARRTTPLTTAVLNDCYSEVAYIAPLLA